MANTHIDDQDLASEVIKLQTANDVTVAVAAGAANGMLVTVQSAKAEVQQLDLYFSDAATGIGLTAAAFSGSLVASTGAIKDTPTAKKSFVVTTDATGKFEGTLTDTAKTATAYTVVVTPDGSLVVSAISGTKWG